MNKFILNLFRFVLLLTSGYVLFVGNAQAETLPELNQSDAESRVYEFVSGETAVLDEDMGITGIGSFSVTGLDKTTNSIVFNSFSGFVVSNFDTNLTVSNLTLSDAIAQKGAVLSYTTDFSTVTLNNLDIRNNSSISTSNVTGGAIYTIFPLTLTNTNLTENSAISEEGEAKGGAIYSTADISIVADSDNVEIVDNYTQSSGTNSDNAIYIADSNSTLTLNATNNGSINLQDSVDGDSGYKVHITGDGTGKVTVNNIKNAEVSADNVKIDFTDNKTTTHTVDNLAIGENVEFAVDVDLENAKSDTLTSENGSGTMNISEISLISSSDEPDVTVQVLDNAGDIELSIEGLSEKVKQNIESTMYNDYILADSVELATTVTDNDSIKLTGAKDLLYEMSKNKGTSSLVFRTPTEYVLTKDLENIPRETLLSIYSTPQIEQGVINANGHSMFKLKNEIITVELRDMEIKNASTAGSGSVAYIENSTGYFNATNVTFKDNHSDENGGVVYSTDGRPNISDSTFQNNTAGGSGGALYITNNTTYVTNTSFKDNEAGDKGGAIYADGNLTVRADGGESVFEGNSANGENNAIYVDRNGTLTLSARNNGVIEMNDSITGTERQYTLNVSGDSTGNINLNNTVENAKVVLKSGNLNLAQENLLEGNAFTASGGNLNLVNGQIGNTEFSRLNISGTTNLAVDVDLANKTMDRLTADTYGTKTGIININIINLISDTESNKTKIFFADSDIKSRVRTSVSSVVYSKIYKYNVSYNKSNGYFTFSRGGGGGGGDHDLYNPAILTGAIGQQVAYLNQLANYDYATYHAGTYMMLPKRERARLYNMRTNNVYSAENFSPTYVPLPEEIKSVWVRPYSSFESVPLKHGPKVSSVNYGLLAGGDSDMISLKRGFKLVYGGYFGYNGNNYHYKNVHALQQGGLIGGTVNIYRGNFFNTLTANAGWQINSSDTAYGSDFTNMLVTGFSDKLGYNIEAMNGRLIFQPSLAMGYTYIGSFDYTSSNNVRIKTDPLNVIHFVPAIKIIGNLQNGWQPYGIVNIVCNFGNNSHYKANDVVLNSMSVDPYVEYGFGLQRRWKDKYSGFAQVTIRSGGRRGAAILFGFRCMLGKIVERTANIFHPDPERRVAMFKEKKDPNIVVDNIVKQQNKTEKPQEVQKPKVASSAKPKTSSKAKNALKKIKEKIMYICKKDVSAKVVKERHPDGVYNSGLSGMKNVSYDSNLDFKDNDRNSVIGTKPMNIAKDFDDYKVTKVDIDMNNDGSVLKTDFIKKLSSHKRLFFINQRLYPDVNSISGYGDYGFELINLQF